MCIKRFIEKLKQFFAPKGAQTRLEGTIKFFDRKKRFGFIISGKEEYFFHAQSTKAADFKRLQDGRAVSFYLVNGKKGPQADGVELL